MIRSLVLLTIFLATVSAFNPTPRMQMTMGVESFQNKIAKALGVGAMAVALAGPLPVLADGAVSASTEYRARTNYGTKIMRFEKAVNSGDFNSLSDKSVSNAFDLFISGTTRGSNAARKELKAKEIEIAANFKDAVNAKDGNKLKSAYNEFIKVADLKPDYKPNELGQTDSSGYSPTWGTERQYIYQR